jgi:hypothetical protein
VASLFGSENDTFIDSILSIELEVALGDQTDIDISTGQASISGDVSTVSAHQPDDSDSVLCALSFNLRGVDELYRLLNSCVEAKTLINQWNVVVNCFWNATNRDPDVFGPQLLLKSSDALMSSISTNDVELVNAFLFEGFNHLVTVIATS